MNECYSCLNCLGCNYHLFQAMFLGRATVARKAARGPSVQCWDILEYGESPSQPPQSPTFFLAMTWLFLDPADYATCLSQHRQNNHKLMAETQRVN